MITITIQHNADEAELAEKVAQAIIRNIYHLVDYIFEDYIPVMLQEVREVPNV